MQRSPLVRATDVRSFWMQGQFALVPTSHFVNKKVCISDQNQKALLQGQFSFPKTEDLISGSHCIDISYQENIRICLTVMKCNAEFNSKREVVCNNNCQSFGYLPKHRLSAGASAYCRSLGKCRILQISTDSASAEASAG